jgi:hypothetical protein
MITAALLLAFLSLPTPVGGETVRYDDVSLDLDGDLLDHRFVDLKGDGVLSLCLAVRMAGGERELRLHTLGASGFDPEPARTIRVLEDVTAYGFADVREESGDELLFLTRSGAWSYSLTKSGYRGNIRRLAKEDLLYDVPDNRALPFWAYTLPAPSGDFVLLPGRRALGVWGPAENAGADDSDSADSERTDYERTVDFSDFSAAVEDDASSEEGDDSGGRRMTLGTRGTVRIEHLGDGVFLGEDEGTSATLLRDGKSYTAPALVDLDGDGDLDLVQMHDSNLYVFRSDRGSLSEEPSSVEAIPDYLTPKKELSLSLVDIDGDGDRDLLARMREDMDGFENVSIRILILINDGTRLLPEAPDQVLRFEAAIVRAEIVDIDGDSSPDLVVRKFELPSMLETVTGLEFRLITLIFFADGSASPPFERRPSLKETQVFDENTVGDAVKNRLLKHDCDGDGIPDLVEIDLQGRIAIRRLRHESGFFSGDSWELDENPWKRFETRGSILSIEVEDLNGDGLADIVSPGARSFTLFLSSRVR